MICFGKLQKWNGKLLGTIGRSKKMIAKDAILRLV